MKRNRKNPGGCLITLLKIALFALAAIVGIGLFVLISALCWPFPLLVLILLLPKPERIF